MEAEKLFAVHSTLHLVFHRNKNQHGKAKWWKWLSILKRTTFNLARSLDCQGPHSKIYRQYLAAQVVPQCYLAFSTVVADGQFSTMGTMLLATLARLAKVTGIDKDLKTSAARTEIRKAPTYIKNPKTEDLGEVLSRPRGPPAVLQSGPVNPPEDVNRESKNAPKAAESKSKKKKKRRKDAIDDLFDGLF